MGHTVAPSLCQANDQMNSWEQLRALEWQGGQGQYSGERGYLGVKERQRRRRSPGRRWEGYRPERSRVEKGPWVWRAWSIGAGVWQEMEGGRGGAAAQPVGRCTFVRGRGFLSCPGHARCCPPSHLI